MGQAVGAVAHIEPVERSYKIRAQLSPDDDLEPFY
jgi:hypothetical protein